MDCEVELAQETLSKNKIFAINSEDVPVEDFTKSGAENVKVRYLIDDRQGSERFALRLYTVQKGGCTPLDQHNYEHQVYILSGQGFLRGGELTSPVLRELHNGDTAFVPSNAVHRFINERDEPPSLPLCKGQPEAV